MKFSATKHRFDDSEPVELSLVNNTGRRIELFGGAIYSVRTANRMVRLQPEGRFLGPGDEHSWTWTTTDRAGQFEARFRTSAGAFGERFDKGAYFTLEFEGSDDSFTIWVRERKPINQLRADLGKPQGERRIVSGIVARAVNYNPDWSYSMDPDTIVLGDVFTEVCDASPRYVENHRRAWMGDRWCPWSSNVASEGR